jgi:hypothetical protein
MAERLVVLSAEDPAAAYTAQQQLRAAQGAQQYGSYVFIVDIPPRRIKALEALPAVAGINEGTVPDQLAQQLDETGRLGVAAWNERHTRAYREAKQQRTGEGRPWDHPDVEPEG